MHGFIVLRTVDTLEFIRNTTIVFILRAETSINFHLISGRVVQGLDTFDHYVTRINDKKFIRVHPDYIVNTDHLVTILMKDSWQCIMKDQTRIPISMERKPKLVESLKGIYLS